MDDSNIITELGQVSVADAGTAFRGWLRGEVRHLIADLMAEEVTALCGVAHYPRSGSDCRRWGSTRSGVRIDGERQELSRPRVRRASGDRSEELHLASYEAVRHADDLRDSILRAVAAGVSSRDQSELYPSAKPSRSAVSRLWVVEGRKRVEELRDRDLAAEAFFALLLDGIALSDDLTGIVALGITLDGRKQVLDFEIGAQESVEVCDALLGRMVGRGLAFAGPPLVVLDGSKALRNSALRHFPTATVQRCLVHKERNIKRCLSRRYHGELNRLFGRLRNVEGEGPAREVLGELHGFLDKHSRKAVESLAEVGDELISLHRLGAPSTLHTTLLSTNCIENPFRNVRAKIGRVKRWRAETDQAERWLAYGLLTAEKGFRRIQGYRDIPLLLKALKWPPDVVEASLRSALGPTGRPYGDGQSSTTPQAQAGSEATCPPRTGQQPETEVQ